MNDIIQSVLKPAIDKALKPAIEKSFKDGAKTIIIGMIENGFPNEVIVNVSNYPIEEIKKIRAQIKNKEQVL